MGRKDNPISDATNSVQARMRQARQAKNISLTGLAARTGFTKGYLSSIENGSGTPSEDVIRAYEHELELDEGSLMSLLGDVSAPRGRRHRSSVDSQKTHSEPASSVKRKDIIATPIIRRLHGRRVELRQLQQWLTEDRCTLVSVLGMGGTGKTTLVAYLLNQLNNGTINHELEYIAWYSLQDAPQLSHIIERFSNLFSDRIRSTKEEHPDVETLIELFSNHRCLLVLDDFESVFASNSSAGQYEGQHANYGKLLQRVGESNHQSCLLLISREKPKEITRVEGETSSVRSMELAGIMSIKEVKNFLEGEKLFGEDKHWEELVKRYDGNPLALKLISSTIREMFGGEIATFLAQGETTFGDLSTFLDEQFERLSEDERTIFYWLAVERGSVSLDDLKKDVAPRLSGPELSAKLISLRQRFLIDYQGPTRIALQPAILAYITNKLIRDICNEILNKTPQLLATHALVKAQAEDYVRNDQIHHILLPIRDYLVQLLGRDGVEQLLRAMLDDLQKTADMRKKTGYTGGNILNLLVHLKGGLNGFNFSRLAIRQSYLQRATLHDVDFSYSDLSTSVFAENFRGITSLSLNSHSKLLAAGTINGDIWIWDASSGMLKSMHPGDASWICASVSFSPDGQLLASGSEDNIVRLWDVQRGMLLQELRGHTGSVSSVAFSPDNKLLASGSEDKCTIVWDVSNPKAATHFRTLREHQEKIWAVAFHPYVDEMMLATGSDDGVIILWNAATGEKLWTLTEKSSVYNEAVYALAFSPNGKWLASGGKDCTVRLWDVDTGELHKMLEGHDDWVWSVAFSRDSDTIASGSEDKSVRTWDVKSGKLLHILSGHTGSVWAIAFDTQHDIFVSGGIDRSIRFWNVQRGVCLRVLQGYMNGIRSIAYNPRKRLLASVGEDYNVYLWQSDHEHETHDPYTPYGYKTLVGHTNVIWAAAFHPDGQLLVTGGDDKTIRFWDTHTGMLLDTRQEHDAWIRTLAFSPDGERFASGGDGNIHIWNTRHRTHTAQLPGHKAPVRTIAFHPDNTLLASGSDDGTLYLRQLDGLQRTELRRQEQSSLVLPAHELGIWSLAFSHDGKLLASGSEDQTIRLWDAHSGRYMNTFEGDISWIGTLAFHPTQHILASGGGDNLVRLWDIKTGRVVTTLRGHSGPVSSLAFIIEDGSTLASGSHDGTIIIWDTQTGKLIQRLQADRPYERMNISHVAGLNDAQIRMLKALGAVEEELQ